jgi:hypothetical protein
MFFVEARYQRSPDRAAAQVRYISHREEGLTDGRRRELFGIGERYRALRGDEPAIRRALRDDARGLRNPAYFRFIMTVDNAAAERFKRLDGLQPERLIRDAVDKTFRGTLRGAQGVYAVHHHGGVGRPAHPHVHALLSPRFENRMAVHISPQRIQRVKERWEREVLAGLQRHERRLDRMRLELAPRLPTRPVDREDRVPLEVLPVGRRARWDSQLELFGRTRRAVRVAPEIALARQWLRFGWRGTRCERNPEKAARRAAFRLASKAMPRGLREALWALRGLRAIGNRQR